jgi:hypothetical protein
VTQVKANKLASVQRKKQIIRQNANRINRPSKGQDSPKVHNTKGKNLHGRTF